MGRCHDQPAHTSATHTQHTHLHRYTHTHTHTHTTHTHTQHHTHGIHTTYTHPVDIHQRGHNCVESHCRHHAVTMPMPKNGRCCCCQRDKCPTCQMPPHSWHRTEHRGETCAHHWPASGLQPTRRRPAPPAPIRVRTATDRTQIGLDGADQTWRNKLDAIIGLRPIRR